MKRLTLRTAIRLAKKAAAGNPHRIAACKYVHGSRPECIVGEILVRDLGIKPLDLAGRGVAAATIIPTLGIDATPEALRFLNNVQAIQDNRANEVRTPEDKNAGLSGLVPRDWRSAVNKALDVEKSRAARV